MPGFRDELAARLPDGMALPSEITALFDRIEAQGPVYERAGAGQLFYEGFQT